MLAKPVKPYGDEELNALFAGCDLESRPSGATYHRTPSNGVSTVTVGGDGFFRRTVAVVAYEVLLLLQVRCYYLRRC